MGGFDSPLGKKSFGAPQMREFEVPDESGFAGPPMENDEPVVRRRQAPQINADQIRDFQAKMQREEMPVYDEDAAEIERQIRQARKEKISGKSRLDDGAKRRIEMLLGMTRSYRHIEVSEVTFDLQTLKSKEMRESLMVAAEYDGTIQGPFELRRQLLARSISKISDIDFASFIGTTDIEGKLQFIDAMYEPLISRVYEEYLILAREARDKYSIKTAQEAKEVLEDLKK